MPVPNETGRWLIYQGYEPIEDFEVYIRQGVAELEWLHTDPEPTLQQITDGLASAGYLTWSEEHGGDPVKTARRITKEATSTPTGKLLVALVSTMAKNGIFGAATKQQIINAILAEVDLGEAD